MRAESLQINGHQKSIFKHTYTSGISITLAYFLPNFRYNTLVIKKIEQCAKKYYKCECMNNSENLSSIHRERSIELITFTRIIYIVDKCAFYSRATFIEKQSRMIDRVPYARFPIS